MHHPAAIETLPEATRKALAGPAPLRGMLARGLAPLPAPALVSGLYALSFDPDEKLSAAAQASFDKLSGPVLDGALGSNELVPEVLDRLAERHPRRELHERVVQHPNVSVVTVVRLARTGDEALTELIATNEQRMLAHPEIIEALYHNRATRMSTADRIVDLAARNHVEVAIVGFKDICAALQNQLIPEPGEELPSDQMFREAVAEAEDADRQLAEDEDVVEQDDEGRESVKNKFQRVVTRIQDMTITELMRTAQIGTVSQRLLLIRSNNRVVAKMAMESPLNQPIHAVRIAASREVASDILRIIHRRKDWLQVHQIKSALASNPKTPPEIAMSLLPYLRDNELRTLSRSRNVSPSIKANASQLLNKRAERSDK